MNINGMGDSQEYIPETDIRSAADPKSQALGILERGSLSRKSNDAMARDLANLGFRAVGGDIVPIPEGRSGQTHTEYTIRINPLPYAGTLETAPLQAEPATRVVSDPISQGV